MRIDGLNFYSITDTINKKQEQSNVDFSTLLKKELDKVNDYQINAEESTMDLITGEASDIHQVLIATEEARLSLELAVQIRNKLVDAYQDISRMQI